MIYMYRVIGIYLVMTKVELDKFDRRSHSPVANAALATMPPEPEPVKTWLATRAPLPVVKLASKRSIARVEFFDVVGSDGLAQRCTFVNCVTRLPLAG